MKLSYSTTATPLTTLAALAYATNKKEICVQRDDTLKLPRLELSSTEVLEADDFTLARTICSAVSELHQLLTIPPSNFQKSPDLYRVEVDSWIDLALGFSCDAQQCLDAKRPVIAALSKRLSAIDEHLRYRTVLVGHQISLADIALFFCLGKLCQPSMESPEKDGGTMKYAHLMRWWNFVKSLGPIASTMPLLTTASAVDTAVATKKSSPYEGKLPGAVKGLVVTRFPPEPSGYLHIGHAKAALLNAYYAKLYEGRLLVRFDDTNPAKEKMEFEEAILEDLRLLEIDVTYVSHTSDYFEAIQAYCEKLLRKGIFYVDDTPLEMMRQERNEGIESRCRQLSVEENLCRWEEMKKGTQEGIRCCVRAKIDMQSKNKCMRDPVMYRCIVDVPHHIHGRKYNVYPMYDFACPIVDSLEGVTHAMRTNEYADRIPQYQWVITACGLRPVTIYEFSRLNFVNTVLSKRKLQWIVDAGIVESWEDPRFPTVRGIRRRGLTVQALLEFLLEQGPSKNVNLMEWDKLWTKNKQILDPIVPRYMAVSAGESVLVSLSNGPSTTEVQPRNLHPKNPSVGEGLQIYDKFIRIEHEDAETLEPNEEITLMRWQNAIVEAVDRDANGTVTSVTMRLHPDGDFKKTKKKLHWIATPKEKSQHSPCTVLLREYDHLIKKKKPEDDDKIEDICNPDSVHDTEALADPALSKLKEGDFLQLERRGYFRVDKASVDAENGTKPVVLIKIPDGKSKPMSIIQGKVDAAKLAKGE